MPNRKAIYTTLFLLLALAFIMGGMIFYAKNSRDLAVIFFDVGQGDAILVSQGGNQMLIDGGKNGKIILEKLGRYIPFWDRTIEAVVATHPDQDHIGGLIDVIENYKVDTVIETKAQSDSQTFLAWEEAEKSGHSQILEAIKGLTVKFSEGTEAQIIYPFYPVESPNKSNANQHSIVMKLKSGENSFLFTGDLPNDKEFELISDKFVEDSQVLKVSHHGSKYSTSEKFLNAVNPKEAVISVGKNNMYGHPAREVLDRLLKHGIKIFRTDEIGDIVYKCNPPAGGQSEKCNVEFK